MKSRNKLILEFTEFNNMRLNPDVGQMAVNVPNPQLSINAFDKHQDVIRQATSKLNGLLQSLSNSTQFNILKSKLSLESQNITSMKVIRILKNGIKYDVYIEFIIGENSYWGVVEDVLDESPNVKSEAFKDGDLVLTPEWVIKTKGLIVKIIKRWLTPENGKYKLIANDVYCTSVNSGKLLDISKNTEVEVVRSYDNKIVIKHDSDYYELTGDNYVYFNYWFMRIF